MNYDDLTEPTVRSSIAEAQRVLERQARSIVRQADLRNAYNNAIDESKHDDPVEGMRGGLRDLLDQVAHGIVKEEPQDVPNEPIRQLPTDQITMSVNVPNQPIRRLPTDQITVSVVNFTYR
jgi:hypothetical protein